MNVTETIRSAKKIDYEILGQEIGGGIFSKIYLGRRKSDQKLFSIKCIPIIGSNDNERKANRSKIIEEINTLKGITVQGNTSKYWENLEDSLVKPNMVYIITTYMDRGSLSKNILTDINEYKSIFEKTVFGLNSLGAFFISHGNINPDTILLNSAGDVKYSDFSSGCGYSMFAEGVIACDEISSRGNPEFLDPQLSTTSHRIRRNSPTPEKSDIFSLGMTLFRVLTGKKVDFYNKSYPELLVAYQSVIRILKSVSFIEQKYKDILVYMLNPFADNRPTSGRIISALNETKPLIFAKFNEDRLNTNIANILEDSGYQPKETDTEFLPEPPESHNEPNEDDEEFTLDQDIQDLEMKEVSIDDEIEKMMNRFGRSDVSRGGKREAELDLSKLGLDENDDGNEDTRKRVRRI